MTRPVVSATAEEAFNGLVPWTQADESFDWPLLRFIEVLTEHLDEINQLVRDGEFPGWSPILDADRIPVKYLSWLGQFVGVNIDLNLGDDEQRRQLKEVSGWRRGTPASMIAAAQLYLSGTKAVTLYERDTSPYHLTVHTFTAETPNAAAVLAALLSEKPAGIVLDYQVVDGLTYAEISASGKTYDELTALFPTPNAMKTAQSV